MVVLMGARQTGKSTLVQSEPFLTRPADRLYLTLDDLSARERAAGSPDDPRPRPRDLRGLEAFRDEYPDRFRGGLLLHTGDETQWLSDRILGVPWDRVV